jgi:hypothetical protein
MLAMSSLTSSCLPLDQLDVLLEGVRMACICQSEENKTAAGERRSKRKVLPKNGTAVEVALIMPC